mmetsp:Transcript_626/g.1293  ORF Transcript_626/g.1293 Transcript_626/m.1293 type:complete len:95 (-) Transcript_626:440-724(-)
MQVLWDVHLQFDLVKIDGSIIYWYETDMHILEQNLKMLGKHQSITFVVTRDAKRISRGPLVFVENVLCHTRIQVFSLAQVPFMGLGVELSENET